MFSYYLYMVFKIVKLEKVARKCRKIAKAKLLPSKMSSLMNSDLQICIK